MRSTPPPQALEAFQQDRSRVLSLFQQVRRLPRRQGDADDRRRRAASSCSAIRPRAIAPACHLSEPRQRRRAAAIHRLRADRHRRAAQSATFRPMPIPAISISACAARCAPISPSGANIAACSGRRPCATSRCARSSSTTARPHAARRGAFYAERDTDPAHWYPRGADGNDRQVRRSAEGLSRQHQHATRPSTARPGDRPALTDARDRRHRRLPQNADGRLSAAGTLSRRSRRRARMPGRGRSPRPRGLPS